MQQLPRSLRCYLWLVNLACAVLVLWQGGHLIADGGLGRLSREQLFALGAFLILATAAHYAVLQVTRTVIQDLATPVQIAAILLFPVPYPLLLTLMSSGASEAIRHNSPLHKHAFNVSHPTLTVGMTTALCSLLTSPTHLLQQGKLGAALPMLVLLIALAYVLDVAVIVGIFAILQQRSPFNIWWREYRHALLPELAASSIGVAAAILWYFDPLALALAALPVVALRVAFYAVA